MRTEFELFEKIGKYLRFARQRRHLGIEELSCMLELKHRYYMSKDVISRTERGTRVCRADEFIMLMDVLGIPIDEAVRSILSL